jgi:hypothetical protein
MALEDLTDNPSGKHQKKIYTLVSRTAKEYYLRSGQEIPYYLVLGDNWFALCQACFHGITKNEDGEIYTFKIEGTYAETTGSMPVSSMLSDLIEDGIDEVALFPSSKKREEELDQLANCKEFFCGGYSFVYGYIFARVYFTPKKEMTAIPQQVKICLN